MQTTRGVQCYQMYMLGKEKSFEISQILANKYYQKWVDYYRGVLRLTRDKRYKYNGKKLLIFQYGIAKTETLLWKKLKEGRILAKIYHEKSSLSPSEQKELTGIEEHIFIHEQLIRISKTICDGIAWRNLGYDYMFILSSARGFGSGAIDYKSPSFRSVYIWAHRISENLQSVVIINDLTRFLRIGDLTDIKDGIPFIHEIKKYGKDIKNMFTLKKVNGKLSEQAIRLLELQRIALTGTAKVGSTNVGKNFIDIPIDTNFNKVKKLIFKSKVEITVSEQIEPYLTIEVTNFLALMNNKETDLEKLKAKSIKVPISITHSNWDSFYSDERGNFLRMVVPYSIFPFTNEDCINFMSGNYLVQSKLDIPKLRSFLHQNGWETIDTDEKELDNILKQFEANRANMFSLNQPLYKEDTMEDVGLFTIKRGAFHMSMGTWLYSKLTSEFYSSTSLLNILEFAYKRAAERQSGDVYFPVFVDENKIWN